MSRKESASTRASGLAFDSPELENQAKVGIFAASIAGGVLGAAILITRIGVREP